MRKPKIPCSAYCDARSDSCHNSSCPYGWNEYQKEKQEWLEYTKSEKKRLYNYFETATAGRERCVRAKERCVAKKR